MFLIYYLCKEDGIPFYVGRTKRPKQRFRCHKSNIGKCKMVILERLNTSKLTEISNAESFWIWYFKFLGFDLTNVRYPHFRNYKNKQHGKNNFLAYT